VSLQGNIAPGQSTYMGRGDGTGPTVNAQGNGFSEDGNPIETFSANMKVRQGDYVGIDSTSTSALYCSSGGAHQLIFSPTLGGPMSQLATTSKTDGRELFLGTGGDGAGQGREEAQAPQAPPPPPLSGGGSAVSHAAMVSVSSDSETRCGATAVTGSGRSRNMKAATSAPARQNSTAISKPSW
jgi:hypothetical protein